MWRKARKREGAGERGSEDERERGGGEGEGERVERAEKEGVMRGGGVKIRKRERDRQTDRGVERGVEEREE